MFRGTYYKHQNNSNTVCFIPGTSNTGEFLQVITNDNIYQFNSLEGFKCSKNGIDVNLPTLKGNIKYSKLTPLKSDIMGPFKFLPMQCRHKVYSMHHKLQGGLTIEGKYHDFTGGIGYIEADSGYSFPEKYLWLHCNDFNEKCSIMASVAKIPFLGFNFWGCICAIVYKDKEYRFATYNGVKIVKASPENLVLTQGQYKFCADIIIGKSQPLKSPVRGNMTGIIHESNTTKAKFKLYKNEKLIFSLESSNTSFECNL